MGERRVEAHGEGDLVARAREGDRQAFAELVRLHQDEVYTLAVRLTGDGDIAADVAQEALIRAWRALPRFRGESTLSTWLYRITVNTAWTMRRRRRRHQAVSLDTVGEVTLSDGSVSPEAAGEAADLRRRLGAALASLSEAQRAVVVLKDVYGWTHAEVAEAVGITVGAAKVRLHRAHRRLQDRLAGERDR